MSWYVITGGASSGITTTTNYIALEGYHTIPEAARVIIDTEMAKGATLQEIRKNEQLFQEKVLKKKKELEQASKKERTIFFQRGIPDTLAYYRLIGADPTAILQSCKTSQYKKIFLLEPLPYKQDHARVEGEEQSKKLFTLLKEAYEELEMPVVVIPKASVEERAHLILSEIEKD